MRDGLTYAEIEQACANIGFPIECGACAALFFTGTRDAYGHGPGCPNEPNDVRDDGALPEDGAIAAAHPTKTGRHAVYAEAMRLVGARHSKGGLVALVNWLLFQRDDVTAEMLMLSRALAELNDGAVQLEKELDEARKERDFFDVERVRVVALEEAALERVRVLREALEMIAALECVDGAGVDDPDESTRIARAVLGRT